MIDFFTTMREYLAFEEKTLRKCKSEIAAKNIVIMRTLTFAASIVMAIGCAVSFSTDIYTNAGFEALRYIYLVIVIFSASVFLLLSYKKNLNVTAMIYVVNAICFTYAFFVSSSLPTTPSVTFITVLFMAATLYIDSTVRIGIFSILGTAIYLFAISFYKEPTTYTVELINTITVAILALVIGVISRTGRIQAFAAQKTLHNMAFTDQLTNISNRRMLFDCLKNAADPQENPLILPKKISKSIKKNDVLTAFSLIDLDYFKLYNDTYGHQMGDECLRKVAAVFLSMQKKYNIHFFRYGGEEFVLAFYDYSLFEIENILSILYKEVELLQIPHEKSEFDFVTISAGTTLITEHGLPHYEAALTKADIALYEAKNSGRNKVLFYNENMQTEEQIKLNTRQRKEKIQKFSSPAS